LKASGGGSPGSDTLLDIAHQSEIHFPQGTLVCISPDSGYAVTTGERSSGFSKPTEYQLHALATDEVVASVVLCGFLVLRLDTRWQQGGDIAGSK